MCTDKPAFKMVRERTVNTRLQTLPGIGGCSSSGGETINYVGQTCSAGSCFDCFFGRKENEIFYEKEAGEGVCSHLLLPFSGWNGAPGSQPREAPRTHLVVQQASGVSESLRAGRTSVGTLAGV